MIYLNKNGLEIEFMYVCEGTNLDFWGIVCIWVGIRCSNLRKRGEFHQNLAYCSLNIEKRYIRNDLFE